MPEKVFTWAQQIAESLIFALIGALIGLGQLLGSSEPLSRRIVVGRALSTGGMAMAAGAVLVWVPELPLIGKIGVAAALASLGTSGIERLLQRVLLGRG